MNDRDGWRGGHDARSSVGLRLVRSAARSSRISTSELDASILVGCHALASGFGPPFAWARGAGAMGGRSTAPGEAFLRERRTGPWALSST